VAAVAKRRDRRVPPPPVTGHQMRMSSVSTPARQHLRGAGHGGIYHKWLLHPPHPPPTPWSLLPSGHTGGLCRSGQRREQAERGYFAWGPWAGEGKLQPVLRGQNDGVRVEHLQHLGPRLGLPDQVLRAHVGEHMRGGTRMQPSKKRLPATQSHRGISGTNPPGKRHLHLA
jgi:hypothetical protein